MKILSIIFLTLINSNISFSNDLEIEELLNKINLPDGFKISIYDLKLRDLREKNGRLADDGKRSSTECTV